MDNNATAEPACWVKICDRLPPHEKEVVACDNFRMFIVWYDHKWKLWFRFDEDRDENFTGEYLTHWLDVPDQPGKVTP